MPAHKLFLRTNAERAHTIAHTLAACSLLLAATRLYPHMEEHPFGFWFSLGASFILFLGIAVHLLWRHHPKNFLAAMSIVGGLILMVEAWEQAHNGTEYIQYVTAFAGLLYIVFGLVFHKLRKHIHAEIDEQGILVRPTFFRKRFFAWEQLASAQAQPWTLELKTKNNQRHTFPLDHHMQSARVTAEINHFLEATLSPAPAAIQDQAPAQVPVETPSLPSNPDLAKQEPTLTSQDAASDNQVKQPEDRL